MHKKIKPIGISIKTLKLIKQRQQHHYEILINNKTIKQIKLINKFIRKLRKTQSHIPGWNRKVYSSVRFVNPLNIKLKNKSE